MTELSENELEMIARAELWEAIEERYRGATRSEKPRSS
jgi:hypothetical protein